MARVFIDSFEAGNRNLWDYYTGGSVNSSSYMYGTYCFAHTGTNNQYLRKLVPDNDEYYVAIRLRANSFGSGNGAYIAFMDGSTVQSCIAFPSGTITAYRGYRGTSLGTGGTISTGVNHLIEVRAVIHDTAGIFQVKVDGELVIDVSTVDTQISASATINQIRFGVTEYVSPTAGFIDNVIIDDSDWIGSTLIEVISPTGAGNSTDWDASAGSNYECVDEIPVSDTDYVSTNVVDEVDLYALGDLTGDVAEVKCVQVQATVASEGAPTPTKLDVGIRTNSTDYFGTGQTPGTSFDPITKLWEVNPNTTNAWTESEINALEAGIKAIT